LGSHLQNLVYNIGLQPMTVIDRTKTFLGEIILEIVNENKEKRKI